MEQITTSNQTFTEKWTRFFNEYYSESDVDIMCNKASVFDFMDEVTKLLVVVKKNLNEIVGKDVSDTIEIEAIKSLMIVVDPKYIE